MPRASCQSLYLPKGNQPSDFCPCGLVLPFFEHHINGIIAYTLLFAYFTQNYVCEIYREKFVPFYFCEVIVWIYWFILWLMDIWVVLSFWLLWIVLLWTVLWMSVGARMYTFWLGIYAEVVLQGHRVMPMLRFSRYCQTASQSTYSLLHCQHQCMRAPVLHPHQHLVKFLSLFWLSLVSAWGISLWFWLALPWWLMELSTFSCAYWPFGCPLQSTQILSN